ncbi:MAG: fibronectin type III domain-containing protein, partial [Bacteroidia bacterium]
MKRLKYFIILVLFLSSGFFRAQNYPVQVTTILTPPFSGYISDYSGIGNQNLKLIVLFNDFTKPSYNIKLKFKLSGQNINIESKNFYYEGPFTLIPGVPLEIEGSDLAGLLNSNNLDFTGLSKQQYESSKVLPEGLYTLTFTAYDFNNPTAIQVSNQSSFSAWMLLNDPPYLNMPFCGNVQPVTNPQNIIFQWTSMNLVSPNSANNTEYEFSLYEVRPKGANPNNILQSLPPIYQTTTNITTLNYGLTEPVLNVGMDYVWRVKAIDLTGRDLFKNQGYSQLCTFTYGNMTQFLDSSAIAITLQGIPLNYRMAKCFWDTLNVYKNYRLYYRKQNGTNWFTNSNIQRSYDHLQNLEPSNTYEAYVKGILLDNSEGPASNTVTIHTPQKTEYVCGQTQGAPPTQNRPLTLAAVGQIWEVGQFEISITSINIPVSPLGQYSGYGKVAVPFLGGKSFNVKFDNIFVNEEFQVVAGRVDVITEGIGNWLHNIDVFNAEQNATYVNGTITNFTVTGGQYCYTVQATNTQLCDTLPTNGNVFVVRDENGNQYTVNLKPPPPSVTGPTSYLNYSADNLDASDSMMVTFNASVAQNFGFDKKEYAAFTENYEVIKLKNTKNYFVSNKSIGENQTDEVLAQIQVIGFSATQLNFKTLSGTSLTSSNEGNNIFKITAIPANASCIYAWYNNK